MDWSGIIRKLFDNQGDDENIARMRYIFATVARPTQEDYLAFKEQMKVSTSAGTKRKFEVVVDLSSDDDEEEEEDDDEDGDDAVKNGQEKKMEVIDLVEDDDELKCGIQCAHIKPVLTSTTNFHRFRGTNQTAYSWSKKLEKIVTNTTFIFDDEGVTKQLFFFSSSKRQSNLQKWIRESDTSADKIDTDVVVTDDLRQGVSTWAKDKNSTRFLVTILHIEAYSGGGHGNAIIFDRMDYKLYRFEPHGAHTVSYDHKKLDDDLENMLAMEVSNFGAFTYMAPSSFLPIMGVQGKELKQTKYKKKEGMVFGKVRIIEARGFCQAWSLLFMHLRLLHPDMGVEDVYRLMDGEPDELAELIRKYMSFIVKK